MYKELTGRLFFYCATGEGPHLCFYSDEGSGGFNNTYSFNDAEELIVFDKNNAVIWSGSPKGEKLIKLHGDYFIVPEGCKDSKAFVDWCILGHKAKLIGNMKSWQEMAAT